MSKNFQNPQSSIRVLSQFDTVDTILFSIVGAFCVGVSLQLLFEIDARAMSGLAFISVASFIVGKFWKEWMLVSVLCAALVLGLFRAQLSLTAQRAHTVDAQVGHKTELTGVVIGDPDVRVHDVRVPLSLLGTTTGVVLAQLPSKTHVQYGDTLTVLGLVKNPESFLTQTNRVFDYAHYEEAHGIDVLLTNATLIEMKEGDWSLSKFLFAIKHAFDAALVRSLPQPQAALAQGILLGEQKGLPPQVTQNFITTGLVHTVALSGQNVAVVSEAVFRAFSFLPRMFAFGASGISIILFVVMVGSGASAVRASMMAIIALTARYFHRQVLALRVLILTVLGMVAWNPLSLLYDPSFELSILAMFALITFAPWVESKLTVLARWLGFRSVVATTIAVEIFTLPALLYLNGVLSLVAFPANLLVLWVVPYAMGFSFWAAMGSLVHPLVAAIPGALAHASLSWMLWVTEIAAKLPYAATTMAPFGAPVVLLIYVPLVAFTLYTYQSASQ